MNNLIDLFIVILYLFVMLIIGFLVGKKENLEGYLVNNRKTKLFLLVFTIVSTSVGMGAFLGTAAAAYKTGISYGVTVFLASVLSLLLVALFAPKIKRFGDKYKAHTLGDWFAVRYSEKNRLLVSIIILLAYFFAMALQFVGIAGLIHVLGGFNFQITLFVCSLIAIIYTTMGGIKSDFYTDAVQFFIIVITTIFILLPFSFIKAGGVVKVISSIPVGHFNLFAFGGVSFFVGGLLFGIPIFFVSMEIWQRIYASTTAQEARKAYLWSSLILFFLFIPVIFAGLVAIKLIPNVDPNFALFELMKNILPVGILGIALAGMLAAAMSTVDSVLLVGSVTILKDIHKTFFNPNLSERQMLKMVRIYTFSYGLLGLLVAYLIPNIIQLQIASAATLAVLAPATIGGFVWKKSTAKASFWSILIGIIVTFALSPLAPTLSFIPGTFVSLILFVVISEWSYKKRTYIAIRTV